MINALKVNKRAFITAWWCPERNDRNKRRLIKVDIVNPMRRDSEQPVQNLLTARDSILLRTEYDYAFKANDEILLNGVWWIIASVSVDYAMENDDVIALVNPLYANAVTIIEAARAGGKR